MPITLLSKHSYQLVRYYGIHLLVLAAIIVVGYSTRFYQHIYPTMAQLYGGDILWATMFYYIFKLILPETKPLYLVLVTLVFSFGIELSQRFDPAWLVVSRKTFIGKMLLGEGFLWSDLICYSIGIAMAYLIDKFWLRIYIQKKV